jgi:hypothetical protein
MGLMTFESSGRVQRKSLDCSGTGTLVGAHSADKPIAHSRQIIFATLELDDTEPKYSDFGVAKSQFK